MKTIKGLQYSRAMPREGQSAAARVIDAFVNQATLVGSNSRVGINTAKRLQGMLNPVKPVKNLISDGCVKSADIKACEALRNEAYLRELRSDEG